MSMNVTLESLSNIIFAIRESGSLAQTLSDHFTNGSPTPLDDICGALIDAVRIMSGETAGDDDLRDSPIWQIVNDQSISHVAAARKILS